MQCSEVRRRVEQKGSRGEMDVIRFVGMTEREKLENSEFQVTTNTSSRPKSSQEDVEKENSSMERKESEESTLQRS